MEEAKKIYGGKLANLVIEKMNIPMVAFLNHLFDYLPEPTKENTHFPNTHVLIDLRDEFLKHEMNGARWKALRAIWNILIIKYDYDGYYQFRVNYAIEKWVERWLNGDWQPLSKKVLTRVYWKNEVE